MRKAPDFWYQTSKLWPTVLKPLGSLYALGSWAHRVFATPKKLPIPVICIGNLVTGGAGKTPTALTLANLLLQKGYRVHFLTRGYGGTLQGPLQVNPQQHTFPQVGDEALLLAKCAPTWVGQSRFTSAQAALQAGAQIVLMDDGFQSPTLYKDFSLVVIDGTQGIGNGCVFPAGPLREPIGWGLARANAVLFIGEDRHNIQALVKKPLFQGNFIPDIESNAIIQQKPLIAFAGIGYPEKFFSLLEQSGGHILERYAFRDHHPYTLKEVESLIERANINNAQAVTTEKDLMRIPKPLHSHIKPFKITLEFKETSALLNLLNSILP